MRDGDDPADEREAQAAVVSSLRPEGEHDVAQLAAAVQEAAEIAAGGAVLELDLGLGDREPAPGRVGRHRRLAAEPGREREDRVARRLGQPPLARERLAGVEAGREADQPPRDSLRDPEAAALPAREGGDRHVAVAVEQRPQVAAEVGVAEQEVAGGARRARRA